MMRQTIKILIKNSIDRNRVIIRNKRNRYVYTKKINRILKNNNDIHDIEEKYIKTYLEKKRVNPNTDWHKAYISVNGKESEKYIPEPIFYNEIEPLLNDMQLYLAYSDKNSYSNFLTGLTLPKTLIKNIRSRFYDEDTRYISIDCAKSILLGRDGKYIIKPSLDTGGAKGVKLLESISQKLFLNGNEIRFEEIIKIYKSDFIIQEALNQSPELSEIHPNSINTIRMMSMRCIDRIEILSTVIRFGNNGSVVDNPKASGGISCGIDSNGLFNNFAIDINGNKFLKHPFSNINMKGRRIPNFDIICKTIKEAHVQLPYFDLISWDIAVNEKNEPVVIELNLRGQEINFHQFNNGPLFGDYTDEIFKKLK